MNTQVRYYQTEAQDAVFAAMKRGVTDQMLVMATGTGKTYTASQITKKFKRCLWLTHSEELITQSATALLFSEYTEDKTKLWDVMKQYKGFIEFLDAIDSMCDSPLLAYDSILSTIDYRQVKKLVGVIKQERMDTEPKIIVASIQTLWRRLSKIDAKLFDIIVVDECHMAAAATWEKAIKHFTYKLLLGLTATPHRADGMPLGNIFDEIVYEYPILKAIEDGFLCELDAIGVKTDVNLDKVRTVAGEFNKEDLKIVNNPIRNQLIVDKYIEYAEGRQAIVFCVDVQHAIDVFDKFQEKGISSSFVVGDKIICPDRKDRIHKFKSGDIAVMTNCMVLTTGFDHPEVACIIMACPTKSLTKFIQCIGRGTRLKKDFKDCKILDMVDVTSKHRLVNTWSLDEDKPLEEKVFMPKELKLKLIGEREARKTKLDALKAKEGRIDLFRIPKVYVSDSERMKEPATEAQLKWIKAEGYDVENIEYTKGMCSKIISGLPATDAQIYKLIKEGYDVPVGLTKGEAQAAFNEIDERAGRIPKWKQKTEARFSDIN
jgi:superfamily II DNA or RNA helicase